MKMRSFDARWWTRLGLLWLVGNSLRMTLLAVPPLLPAIHQSLHLDEKLVGALTGLPVLLLALAAVPGSLLIAYLGARRALLLGLGLVSVAGLARGGGTAVPILFAMTFLMGIGIAISQPALPSLVRQWFPAHIGLATAVYSNGFLIGEIVAASLTAPFILPLVGGSWQLAFVIWSAPVLFTALSLLFLTIRDQPNREAPLVRWWPDWRSRRTWHLGLVLGCASAAYFGTNAFIPDYLKATHHTSFIAAALTSVNLVQLPASILVAIMPSRLVGHRWPVVGAGTLTLASAIGLACMTGVWDVAWAGLLGFATALVFVLSVALPPLLAAPYDVHRLSAAMFTISYACASVAPPLGGAIWDVTHVPATTFAPVVGAGLLMVALALSLNLPVSLVMTQFESTVSLEASVGREE
jgi:CP family cyanate transporter-like MFS transporter